LVRFFFPGDFSGPFSDPAISPGSNYYATLNCIRRTE
jgi:hypothetical protein